MAQVSQDSGALRGRGPTKSGESHLSQINHRLAKGLLAITLVGLLAGQPSAPVLAAAEPPPLSPDWASLDVVAPRVPAGQFLHWSDPDTVFTADTARRPEYKGLDFPDTSVYPARGDYLGMAGMRARAKAAGRGGNPAHINNWGSFAVCPDGLYYLHGGGHGGYDGIETVRFDPARGTWSLFRDNWRIPSDSTRDPVTGLQTWPDNGTSPLSVHIYDGWVCTDSGLLYRFGGARWKDGKSTIRAWVTDSKDPDGWWRALSVMPSPPQAAAAAVGDRVFVVIRKRLYEYQPEFDNPALAEASWEAFLEVSIASTALKNLPKDTPKADLKAAKKVVKAAQSALADLVVGPDKPYRFMTSVKADRAMVYHPGLNALVVQSNKTPRWTVIALDQPNKAHQVSFSGDLPQGLQFAALSYDPKRDALWVWNPRIKSDGMRNFYRVELTGSPASGYQADWTRYPVPAGPAPAVQPEVFTTHRTGVKQPMTRLLYDAKNDVFMIYFSPNEGWWLWRPSDKPAEAGPSSAQASGQGDSDGTAESDPVAATPVTSRFVDPTPSYPIDPGPSEPRLTGDFRICPKMDHPSCDFPSVFRLKKSRKDKGLNGLNVILAPGQHDQLKIEEASDLTIRCEPGAWLGRADGGPRGGGATVSLRFVDDFRLEGCHLQNSRRGIDANDVSGIELRNNSFRNHGMHIQIHGPKDSTNNVPADGPIVVADNLFWHTASKAEFSHAMYISGKLAAHCVITGNRILRTSSLGHGIKLGCPSGLVEANQVLMLDGDGSAPLDIIKGGKWVVRDNLFQAGPNRDNSNLSALAVSARRERGGIWDPGYQEDGSWSAAAHDTLFENNTWIADGGQAKSCAIYSRSPGKITIRGDRLVGLSGGCHKVDDPLGFSQPWADPVNISRKNLSIEPLEDAVVAEGVQRFADRHAAGLPAYDDQL